MEYEKNRSKDVKNILIDNLNLEQEQEDNKPLEKYEKILIKEITFEEIERE